MKNLGNFTNLFKNFEMKIESTFSDEYLDAFNFSEYY